ncbi:CHK domain-containing protein [Aphelenchoides fujianensis]|nr:CHK domain-containing protein [Aphelenchoides fujianensis]
MPEIVEGLIEGTHFTVDFVLEKIRELTGGNSLLHAENLRSFDVQRLSAGEAFMSKVMRVDFEWKEPVDLNSIILKIPGFQNPAGDQDDGGVAIFLERAHTRECVFYEQFAAPPIPLKLPRFFYGSEYRRNTTSGVMILEDMSHHSATVGLLPGFTDAQVVSLFTELGRVHAASWMDRRWLRVIGEEIHDPPGFMEGYRVAAESIRKIKPEVFEKLWNRLQPAFKAEHYLRCGYSDEQFGVPACVVHGDLWAANVLWKREAKGGVTSELSAILDWQMCHSGNPGADLARSLSLNTSAAYRRENTDRLLHIYHDAVQEAMGKPPPFDFDQLKQLYRTALPYVAVLAAFGTPLYYRMASVVGYPQDEKKQEELLDRARCFFEDAIEVLQDGPKENS